ncbi:MAG TPA: hypothetical protein VFW25_15420 [Silvibacterium sp.]|nr:hypothetical protein [Silvibacterium sp.]
MPLNRQTAIVEEEQSVSGVPDACLSIDPAVYSRDYDATPFPFTHYLHKLDLMAFESLCELAGKYDDKPGDYNLAGSAASPEVFASPSDRRRGLKPSSAVGLLDELPLRLLLKRPEDHDDRFRKLMDVLLKQIQQLPGGAHSQKIERAQGSVLISSAAAITPLHFDPEIGFFCQIEGDKIYHVYSPDDLSEAELENFYVRDQVSTCRVDLQRRNPAKEHVYQLKAGAGFHQPQNSPHWVQTCETRSISYTVVFETETSRAVCRARAFNFYQRKLGIAPAHPGVHPRRDVLKARSAAPELLARKIGKRILYMMGK